MNGEKRPDRQSQLTPRSLLSAAYRSIRTGIQQLRTAKGLVALAPLVVSIAAYLKASVVADELFIIMPEAITIKIPTDDRGIRTPDPDISAFFSKSGSATLFISRLTFSLQRDVTGGVFDEDCLYTMPAVKIPGGSSQRLFEPYLFVPRVMNKNYPYELPQGFLVEANQFVPVDLKLLAPSDPVRDQQISKATGAAKVSILWQSAMIELIVAQNEQRLTMCISATVVQPGEPARTVNKIFSTSDQSLSVHYNKHDYGKPPIAPGGQDPGHPVLYTLSVQGVGLDKGVRLYRSWKLDLF